VQHRINHSDDFRRIFRRGKKHPTPLGLVVTLPSEGVSRLGVVVSKAVGGAVVRNLVKRRIRAAFTSLLPTLGSVEVVVKATPGADKLSYLQIKEFLFSATSSPKGSS
jgi:ribonuclease P protein component